MSLSTVYSRFLHVAACIGTSSFLRANYVTLRGDVAFCSSVDGHSGYFHLLPIVHNAAINLCVQVFA